MTPAVLLYPGDPLSRRSPDASHAEEHAAAEAAGLACALLSSEDFDAGRVVARPPLPDGGRVLYRGWMLRVPAYTALEEGVRAAGAEMVTTAADYERCHHLPGWLDRCRDFTAETVVVTDPADLPAVIAELSWPAYFVKDFVKSLTTSRGSIARSAGEVLEVVDLLAKYRGSLEGGVCLRAVEEYVAGSEERYFAVRRRVLGRDGATPPDMVREVAERLDAPFASIDVALRADGTLRLVEVGDGQVSDRKSWELRSFVRVLQAAAAG
jgi:hypothetical protein